MLRHGKKKRRIIIYFVYTFFFFDFSAEQNIEFTITKKELPGEKMKYYNYTKVGTPVVATDFPGEANTLWEIDQSAGKLLAMIDPDADEIQSSIDKGLTWTTEVSGTPGGLLGVSSWHDRANELLYLIEHPGGLASAETYVVDYTNWSVITITKHNGDLGVDIGTFFESDIFLRDSNLEAVTCDGAQIDARRYNNPWASIDTNSDNIARISSVVVVGTVAYFYGDNTAANTLGMYKFDGTTVDTLDIIAATSYIHQSPSRNLAYDGDDTIYFIANDDGTGDNYLYSYGITGDVITKHGVSTYFLMRDRDTATGVKEKGWDWNTNGFKVYQLQENVLQLNLIAIPDITTDYKIYTLTDNFLWATKLNGAMASEIWERVDQSGLLASIIIDHEVEEASQGIITLIKGSIPIVKNMFLRFFHAYTTADPPILYKGTYNFGDEVNGTSGTDIDWVTGVIGSLKPTILSSIGDHKKVMEGTNDGVGNFIRASSTHSVQGDSTVEWWMRTDDVSNALGGGFWFLNSGVSFAGGNILFVLEFDTANIQLRHGNGVGGQQTTNMVVAATDTWYHIKAYMDFTTDQVTISIDGVEIGSFNFLNDNDFSDFDTITFHNAANAVFTTYIDAIGYSWDPAYKIGDNKKVEAEEKIIFEGLVTNFTEDPMQTVTLVNPAKKEVKTILPEGDYTKDADGLISQLIIDYNNYGTAGTLSDGGDLGTITLGGVLTEETIFDGCAKFDGFLWYFNPTGQLLYNNGTVDSTVDYTQANVLSGVNISHIHEEYNKIKVRGAYVDGVQVESAWQEDLESQQTIGINERVFLISFLNTVALCNAAAANILTILAKDPLKVKFTIKDAIQGYIQIGETITFEYAASGKTVSSDQFIITSATINKYGDIRYTIASELS